MEKLSIIEAKSENALVQWQARVMECRNSGMTVKAWCADKGISPCTYYRWQKRVWDRNINGVPQTGSTSAIPLIQFAQVEAPACMEKPSEADVVLRKGSWEVEIRNSASPDLLNRVLRAVNRSV